MFGSTHSLTSELDGSEWSVSNLGLCTTRERAPGTLWIGGWVGPRAGPDAVVKRKIPSPRRESNPRNPIVQPAAWMLHIENLMNFNKSYVICMLNLKIFW
jgi:hypothetical protein